jgi:hypothetical protein
MQSTAIGQSVSVRVFAREEKSSMGIQARKVFFFVICFDHTPKESVCHLFSPSGIDGRITLAFKLISRTSSIASAPHEVLRHAGCDIVYLRLPLLCL